MNTKTETEKKEIMILDMTLHEFLKGALFYAVVLIILAAVMLVLYVVVYERCYNIMNAEDMTVLRFYKSGSEIYAVFFNKIYRLFGL